jgi:hypothetical protein
VAVTTTPLGFKKPDGYELVKTGDNVIADNAQKADDVLTDTRTRLGQVEAEIASGETGPGGLVPDPDNPGLYFLPEA